MNTSAIVVLVALAVVILVLLAWTTFQRQRSMALRERFGPEYNQTLERVGDRRKAEAELYERAKRVQSLDLHPLSKADRQGYSEEWRSTQAEFVDDPSGAVRHADKLISQVMQSRGYPMEDFEQRTKDLSVDHAQVVTNYRLAHDIAGRNDKGQATTEDLRQAFIRYRSLFDDLLEKNEPERTEENS